MIRGSWLLLIVSLVFVTACGSSGRGRPRGKQCPSSYDPVSLTTNPEGNQKISMDPKDDQLPLGVYEYQGAEVYYHDSANDIKIHVKEDVGPQGPVSGNVCLRGLKPEMELLTAVYGIDKMTTESGGKSLFSVRKYQLNFKANALLREFAEPMNEEKPASPHKLYQTKATDFSFVRLAADASKFELRSVFTTGSVRQYLLIRYQLKPISPVTIGPR